MQCTELRSTRFAGKPKILLQFVEAVMPKIETASDAARKEQA